MSLPVMYVKCTHCSFESWEHSPTKHVYKTRNTLVHIPWVHAWCHDCKKIVVAESLEPKETSVFEAERFFDRLAWLKESYGKVIPKDEIRLEIIELDETEDFEENEEDWDDEVCMELDEQIERVRELEQNRLSRISVDDARQLFQIVSDIEEIENDARSILSPVFCRDLFRERSSGPKCLECGSPDFTKLIIQEKKRLQEHEASMHPGCGGILYWEKSGLRVAWIFDALPVRIYDAEGNYIRTEKNESSCD